MKDLESILKKHKWERGKILKYPAHSIDGFLLCSEVDLTWMKSIIAGYGECEYISHEMWPEIMSKGMYQQYVDSVKKTAWFLNDVWEGGRKFAIELLMIRDEETIDSVIENWSLNRKLFPSDYNDCVKGYPVIGVVVGREGLGTITAALSQWFKYRMRNLYEEVKYNDERHKIWLQFVMD